MKCNKDFNNAHLQNIKTVFEEKTGVQLKEVEMELAAKKRALKPVVLIVLIVAVLMTSVFAAMCFDTIRNLFVGDFSSLGPYVQTPHASMSDEKFQITVEEVLTDGHYIFMSGSIEALTKDAREELMAEDGFQWDTISVSPQGSNIVCNESVERRTDNSRYWVYSDRIESELIEPLSITSNMISVGKSISTATDNRLNAQEFTLASNTMGDVWIRISPIGVTIKMESASGETKDLADNKVRFRMQDNEIKTYYQIASMLHGYQCIPSDSSPYVYQYDMMFLDAIPLSEFKSIIVDDTEYDFKNPNKTSRFTLDDSLKPFTVDAIFFGDAGIGMCLPVQEVFDKLGAKMSWDGERLVITYRGSTVEITDHSDTYQKDGKAMPWVLIFSQKTVFKTYEGTLYAEYPVLAESLCIGAFGMGPKFIEEPMNTDGDSNVSIQRTIEGSKETYMIVP